MKLLRMPLALLLLAGCQSMHVAGPQMSGALHWYRNAAEKRAIFEQTYALALQQLRTRAAELPQGTWGVILDVDETVLDNSAYQKEFPRYTEKTWDQWIARKTAVAQPGAIGFMQAVRELGGLVILVTNREQRTCADTELNLQRAGVPHDGIHCMTNTVDKNPRFAEVQRGANGTAPVNVLMWIGDNIQDFPAMSQHSTDFGAFGSKYFVLPNPVYGSWEELPRD
jgi:5'-nucleotidase (lipoprotein e(P4) family)